MTKACLPLVALSFLASAFLPAPLAVADQAAPRAAAATATTAKPLSLERIMAEPLEAVSRPPETFYFSDDGKSVYYSQRRTPEPGTDLWRIELATGKATLVDDSQLGQADVESGVFSPDRRYRLWSADGNLFWRDRQTGATRQLTRTAALESSPLFLKGKGQIAFNRDDAYFSRDLDTGLEAQVADLRLAKDPADIPEADDYLSLAQPRLLEVVRERATFREQQEARTKARQAADPTLGPVPFYLGDDVNLFDQQLSPLGNALLVALEPKSSSPGRQDKMANWVTADGYVEVLDVRSKVGDGKQPSPKILLLDLEHHRQHELVAADVLKGLDVDPLADLRAAAKARKEAASKAKAEEAAGEGTEADAAEVAAEQAEQELQKTEEEKVLDEAAKSGGQAAEKAESTEKPAEDEEGDDGEKTANDDAPKVDRTFEYVGAAWSPDGSQVALQLRSVDNKDRWLVVGSLAEPALGPSAPARWQLVEHQHQHGWINWEFNEFLWLADGSGLVYLTEETGYSHLHLWERAKGQSRTLTSGKFLVGEPVLSPDGKWVYYTANPDHPGIYDVFRVALADGRSERLTQLKGQTEFRLSPDGGKLVLRFSSMMRPAELFVQDAKPGAAAKQLTRLARPDFLAYPWVEPQVVAIPSTHGDLGPVYSRYYPPRNPDKLRGADGKVPAVMFIHGAGYLQNAHYGWSTYQREFLFHTWLSEHGYAVLDMDYRGSAGYGAAWRQAIYRHMGKPEIEDLEDGLAWLVAHHGVDPQRVGLYGGSYGGFMTLMGLFTRPEVFACGAALRPVTDWAHYNHGYTANILNVPEIDPEAYERSSPIEFAEGLTKPLLICAPMQDDNVFFQDTVRLAQKLIELEKNDWEVAIYPVEPHSFRRPSSWLDEYKRIFKLFEGCLAP